jgi:predicted PurR-regulated permease PerM
VPQPLAFARTPTERGTPGIETVAFSLVITAVVVAFLYFGREILVPLALASLLSFVLWPVIQLLRKAGFGRALSVLTAVGLSLAGLVGIGAVMAIQVSDLAGELPRYEANLRDKVRAMKGASMPSTAIEKAADTIQGLQEELKKGGDVPVTIPTNPPTDPMRRGLIAPAGNAANPVVVELHEHAPSVLQTYQDLIKPILSPLTTMALVILFLLFILMQREDLRDRLLRLAGSGDLQRSTLAMNDAADRLSRLFLTQLALNSSFGAVIGIALWFIGVPNPVLWGMLAALMRFVPYVGSIVAAIFPIALAAAVDPSWSMVIATAAMFLVAELLAGQVLEPMLYGQNTGLSPVAVVISALFWTLLWGPVGLLLSTPLTVCLVVLGKHVPALEFLAVVLGDEPALAPEQRLYQRLLAGDIGEVSALAEEELKTPGLARYYDSVAMKALRMAQLDAERGRLPRDAQDALRATILEVTTDLADYTLDSVPADIQDEALSEQPEPSLKPQSTGPDSQLSIPSLPIVCVATRTALDEAAAHLMSQLLTKHGVSTEVIRPSSTSPLINDGRPGGDTVICLSYFGTDNPFHARFLVRRIKRMAPTTKIIAGFWMLVDDPGKVVEWQKSSGVDFATASLAEAVNICLTVSRRTSECHAEPGSLPPNSAIRVA